MFRYRGFRQAVRSIPFHVEQCSGWYCWENPSGFRLIICIIDRRVEGWPTTPIITVPIREHQRAYTADSEFGAETR